MEHQQHFFRWLSRSLVLLLPLAFALLLVRPVQAVPVWNIQTLDTVARGQLGPNSLVLDSNGNPVLSYYDNTWRLKVVRCKNATCSGANPSLLVPNTAGNYYYNNYSSLALDSSGNVFIAYYDHLNSKVSLMVCKPVCTMIVIAASVGPVHGIPLILDSSGNPVIAYDESTTKAMLIHCGDNICSYSKRERMHISEEQLRGRFSTLVLDSRDNPVMAFGDDTGSPDYTSLKFAYCELACNTNNMKVPMALTLTSIATVHAGATEVAMGLDKSGRGRLVISYRDDVDNKLYLHYCFDMGCTMKIRGVVDNTGVSGALVVDGNGASYISYGDHVNGGLKLAYCSELSCQSSTVGNSVHYGWGDRDYLR